MVSRIKPPKGAEKGPPFKHPSLFGEDGAEEVVPSHNRAKSSPAGVASRLGDGPKEARGELGRPGKVTTTATAPPTREEWRALYDAADAFRILAPWEWMDDSMMFAVQNPEDGEMGYCCVMGILSQFMALGLYPGAEGYATYRAVRSRTGRHPDPELRFVQRCLMASFEDRRDQWPEDLKVVKDLGRKYRGKGTWPLFRDHTPGLMPWFLSGAQARFLAGALLVALEVGKRCEGDDTLFHGPPGTVPGFLPGPSRTPVKWNPVRIHAPRVQRDETLPALPADEVRLKKFLKSAARGDMVLEVDVAHAPMAIQDDGRPYFPLILLGVEPRNDFVFSVALASPMEPRMYLLDRFLDGLETQKVLPKEILFKRGEIAALLGASLDLLGVPMRQVKSLPAHDRARRAMETMVCRGK